jgi:hypothetical protein
MTGTADTSRSVSHREIGLSRSDASKVVEQILTGMCGMVNVKGLQTSAFSLTKGDSSVRYEPAIEVPISRRGATFPRQPDDARTHRRRGLKSTGPDASGKASTAFRTIGDVEREPAYHNISCAAAFPPSCARCNRPAIAAITGSMTSRGAHRPVKPTALYRARRACRC